MRNLL
jgi:hypothetical protein